jgi:hypothetical protein
VRVEQQVLGSPAHCSDALIGKLPGEGTGHAPAQARLADCHICDTFAREVRGDAAARRFDLWELGHRKCEL